MTGTPVPSVPPRAASWVRRYWTTSRLIRIGAIVDGTLLAFAVLVEAGARGFYNVHYALAIVPSLVRGFWLTLGIVAVVISVGFSVGFVVGWARTSRFALLRAVGAVYVDFFRSMPPIVLIAFAFLIGLVGLQGVLDDPFLRHTVALWLGALALGLHTGAYQAELIRAGILSVPAGQSDAAESIGLTPARTMFLVVLPQAFRVSLPALGNEFSSVIKDTSLLSVIGWLELSGAGLVQLYGSLRVGLQGPLIVWIEIAILYFALTSVLNAGVRSVENAFRVPGLEAARR